MMRCKDPDLFAEKVALAKVSQNEIARRAAMSPSYLSDIRHGRKGVDETDARVIARLLRARVSELFEQVPRTRRRKAAA